MEGKHQKKKETNIISFVPNGDFYFNKAIKAMEKEQYNKAFKYLNRAIELSPDDSHIHLQLGILEMERQNFEKAYEHIYTAYYLDSNDAENVFFLAEISSYMGFFLDAKSLAEEYLALDPEGEYTTQASDIINFCEFVQEEEAQEEKQEHEAEKFIAQEKAKKFMEDGKFEEAIEVLEKVIDEFPEVWQAYNNLALCYFYVGEIDQARALLKEVLKEHYGNIHALCNLAIISYYEKDENLGEVVELLKKVVPYDFEDRYKLGATLALVGENELAFKWLYSMYRKGNMEVVGYYFWLAHSAYFSGNKDFAEQAWEKLLQLDPSKKDMEPWKHIPSENESNSLENNREFIVDKIQSDFSANRLLGFFLLSKSKYKQEIIAHPNYIDITKYNGIEKLCLAYALNYKFDMSKKLEKAFYNSIQVAEKLYEHMSEIAKREQYLFQMWFVLCEVGLNNGYSFSNTNAIAAAVEYMFHSTFDDKVTKKQFAIKYETTVPTLTKYMKQIIEFLPFEVN